MNANEMHYAVIDQYGTDVYDRLAATQGLGRVSWIGMPTTMPDMFEQARQCDVLLIRWPIMRIDINEQMLVQSVAKTLHDAATEKTIEQVAFNPLAVMAIGASCINKKCVRVAVVTDKVQCLPGVTPELYVCSGVVGVESVVNFCLHVAPTLRPDTRFVSKPDRQPARPQPVVSDTPDDPVTLRALNLVSKLNLHANDIMEAAHTIAGPGFNEGTPVPQLLDSLGHLRDTIHGIGELVDGLQESSDAKR